MARILLLLPTSTYRAHDFMEAANRQGVDVIVASEEASTMESLHRDELLTLDFLDPRGAAERVARLHERSPLAGVVSVDEETAVVASAVGERLGLVHNAPEATARARLKHEMRRALSSAGVPSPRFLVSDLKADPRSPARQVGYPAVLKPVFLSGSRGVVRVDDEESLVRSFDWMRRFLSQPELRKRGGPHAEIALIEEFIAGPEVAVEAILTKGEFSLLALFDKPDPLDGPYFEETIYVTPSRLTDPVRREIVDVTAKAADAMGLRHGPVHAELRLPPEGPPTVVEIAGRSIGGLCSRALRFGVGLSLEEILIRHTLGEDVSRVPRDSRAAGVMMIPIPKGGELRDVRGLDAAKAVAGIEDVVITAHVGKTLVPLPEGSSYLGFIFAREDSPAGVASALRKAHATLVFEIG